MYPDQPGQPQQPYPPAPQPFNDPNQGAPVDYLNQIAPQAPKRGGFSRKQLAVLGGAIVLAFIGLGAAILFNAGRTNTTALTNQLAARIVTTTPVVNDAQKNLRSSNLRALNSTLTIYLSSTTNELASIGAQTDKISSSLLAREDTSELAKNIEDARLHGTIDAVYAYEMAHRLATIQALISQIYNASRGETVRATLEKAYNDLEPIQKQFAEFTP